MEKETLKEQEKKKSMAAAQKLDANFTGESITNFLKDNMGISETMVAALLDVTPRTLLNWRETSYEQLKASGKSQRLTAMYDFVFRATELGVPKSAMVSLLQEPLIESEEANTPLSFIVYDPKNPCLAATTDLIIKNFKKLL